MEKSLSVFVIVICLLLTQSSSSSEHFQLCEAPPTKLRPPCSVKIWGDQNSENAATCGVEYVPSDSSNCIDGFSTGPAVANTRLGHISIKPFLLHLECPDLITDPVVPNIVFRDIKWKKLKFRIKSTTRRKCTNLIITENTTIDDESELRYDCFLALTNGDYRGSAHVLDVDATDGDAVDKRQFLFNIPSAKVLKPITNQTDWKPFIYVENLSTSMQLRLVPPLSQLNFTFQVQVMKYCEDCPHNVVENVIVKDQNSVEEITYDFTPNADGIYYFLVTTIHDECVAKNSVCQTVESPHVALIVPVNASLTFCVAIFGAAMVMFGGVYCIYRHNCRRPSETAEPPKVLVIYPSANHIHAECVKSCVEYLRSECGIDITYDLDIPSTEHGDPFYWAEQAIREASIIIYMVGPKITDQIPNSVYHSTDKTLLLFLKDVSSLQTKDIINVVFEHSDGDIPIETKYRRTFYLIKDWQKLIAYLSRNMLPEKQIMRTQKGMRFIENLTRVKNTLSDVQIDHGAKKTDSSK